GQRRHPAESLPHQAAPRHPPQSQPQAQGQGVARPHVQAQRPQAHGHLVAQVVAVSEAHADVSGDPPPLPLLAL
ncbi:hypothetical protein A2U01_0070122, partial [Trifolium medium]|nr:hypothetical protein [Trifolium medium]